MSSTHILCDDGDNCCMYLLCTHARKHVHIYLLGGKKITLNNWVMVTKLTNCMQDVDRVPIAGARCGSFKGSLFILDFINDVKVSLLQLNSVVKSCTAQSDGSCFDPEPSLSLASLQALLNWLKKNLKVFDWDETHLFTTGLSPRSNQQFQKTIKKRGWHV